MFKVEVADEACLTYKPNKAWMDAHKNTFWSYNLASEVPCEHCGVTRRWHPYT